MVEHCGNWKISVPILRCQFRSLLARSNLYRSGCVKCELRGLAMIEFEIDTTRLEQKLLAASRSIQSSIVQGVSRGTEQLEKQIDDFMFVPLALETSVNQQSTETIATIGVNLNLPPIRPKSRFDRFRRKRFSHKRLCRGVVSCFGANGVGARETHF